jgi:hypothetical protein
MRREMVVLMLAPHPACANVRSWFEGRGQIGWGGVVVQASAAGKQMWCSTHSCWSVCRFGSWQAGRRQRGGERHERQERQEGVKVKLVVMVVLVVLVVEGVMVMMWIL